MMIDDVMIFGMLLFGEGCFHENEIKCYLEIYQGVDDDFDNVDLDC